MKAILGTDETMFRIHFKQANMPARMRGRQLGAVLSIHQSCDGRRERKDEDGERGHIIGPSWVLHLLTGYTCIRQGLQQYTEFNIIILLLGKMN